MEINEKNKKIWDDIMSKQPPVSDTDSECCVCCEGEDGSWQPAVPLGYDDGQKRYDATKELTEGAIKNKDYKTWKKGSWLKDSYSKGTEDIKLFDVVYLFTADWEEPIMPMVLTAVNEENKTVEFSYISYRDDDVKVHSTHYGDKDTTVAL